MLTTLTTRPQQPLESQTRKSPDTPGRFMVSPGGLRARWHLHFTPTSSSWLNLVERWFKHLTDRRLRRGIFTSVPNLIEAIMTWVEHGNADPMRTPGPSPGTPRPKTSSPRSAEARANLAQVKSKTQH